MADRVVAAADQERALPILILDDADFAELRRRRLIFELVPKPALYGPLASRPEWPLFVQRRLELISAKWSLSRIVHLGAPGWAA